MGASEDPVLVAIADGIATVQFHRPERNNAWQIDMERMYFAVLDDLDDNPAVRVIVVTGSGRSFCPGMDMGVLAERSSGDRGSYADHPRRSMMHPLSVRKPMIAAINGGCAGIGLIQALLCDIRFASESAKIAAGFTTRGLVAEFGSSWFLQRLIGYGNAMDLLLSGRAITGVEAAQMGLVNRACAPDDLLAEALDYARMLVRNCSPLAMAAVRRQLFADASRSREESQQVAIALFEQPERSPDFAEGVQSFVQRRPPNFAPLMPIADDRVTPLAAENVDRRVASDNAGGSQ